MEKLRFIKVNFFTFSLQAKRLISIALTVLIVLTSVSGPHALSTWANGNDIQKSSLCSTSSLIDSDRTDTDPEISHCSLCLLNHKIDLSNAAPNNIFFVSSRHTSDLTATVSIQPHHIATFTFNSQAPPKII